ncbi:hypothetical protein [Flavobacterium nitrogenifigens]|uniref:Uncharacterized protein n=1 Tax=Flavobacterium nitrogenifigens TaxID=1617283 RepID=A0A521AFC1_9FLAO|nr:hypothetical protein [Flavobacterium nitrogenifigens]KAF2331486.1 hypothetical protein DM397_12170 [Flavobacterium nitrogenifigens]SMO33400.1 hypothetical protein SAMN06265220_10182 [Flavobacterium nitrogenifigens]
MVENCKIDWKKHSSNFPRVMIGSKEWHKAGMPNVYGFTYLVDQNILEEIKQEKEQQKSN